MNDFKRPVIKPQADKQLQQLAGALAELPDRILRVSYIYALLAENAQLLAEANEHRKARGFKPLPTYDPTGARHE